MNENPNRSICYGYHRTSSLDQNLDRGVKAIRDYCTSNNINIVEIYTDQQTGKNFDRLEYQFLKKRVLPGDTIILSELDRLGRDKLSTLKELQYYKERNVRIMILEIPTTLIDYSTLDNNLAKMMMETINNLLIEMYATFAHAEMEKREKRQREGIETKKLRGEWDDYGRPRLLSDEEFRKAYEKVLAGKLKPFECAKELGLKISTYYKYKKRYEDSLKVKM